MMLPSEFGIPVGLSDFSSSDSLGLAAASDVGQVPPSPVLEQKQLKLQV